MHGSLFYQKYILENDGAYQEFFEALRLSIAMFEVSLQFDIKYFH